MNQKINFTKANYDVLYPIMNRRDSFYPLEIKTIFQQFEQIFGWNAGCSTCPSNIRFVIDRIRPLIEGFQNKEEQEQAQTPTQKPKGRPKKDNNPNNNNI